MKMHPVGIELLHADRWLDVMKLVVVRIFAKAHKGFTVMIVDALFCQIRVIMERSCLSIFAQC